MTSGRGSGLQLSREKLESGDWLRENTREQTLQLLGLKEGVDLTFSSALKYVEYENERVVLFKSF